MKRKEWLAAIGSVFALVMMMACDHGGKLPPAPGKQPPEPEFVFEPQEEIPWPGLSSPNISRDGRTVFIQVGSVERSRVYAMRADTGQEVWRFDAPAGRLKGLSPYSPALSPDGKVLYAPGWDAVYAIRTEDGRLVWRFDLDGQAASPSVDNQGRIYVNTEASTYAVDPAGTIVWRLAKPGITAPEYTSVSIGRRGMLYRSTVLPIVQGLDYAGQLIWEVNLRDFAGMFVGTAHNWRNCARSS